MMKKTPVEESQGREADWEGDGEGGMKNEWKGDSDKENDKGVEREREKERGEKAVLPPVDHQWAGWRRMRALLPPALSHPSISLIHPPSLPSIHLSILPFIPKGVTHAGWQDPDQQNKKK